jgi:hypothetical protein
MFLTHIHRYHACPAVTFLSLYAPGVVEQVLSFFPGLEKAKAVQEIKSSMAQ